MRETEASERSRRAETLFLVQSGFFIANAIIAEFGTLTRRGRPEERVPTRRRRPWTCGRDRVLAELPPAAARPSATAPWGER
jgi:hypothetical protein